MAFTGMSLERDGLTCERQLRKVTGLHLVTGPTGEVGKE